MVAKEYHREMGNGIQRHWEQDGLHISNRKARVRLLLVSGLKRAVGNCSFCLCLCVCVGVLNPYTAKRRDVLENTPPEAQEISLRRGFCTREKS